MQYIRGSIANRRLLLLFSMFIFWFAMPKVALAYELQAPSNKVIVFLVNGYNDCCIYQASHLIKGLERLSRDPRITAAGIELVFAGLDARNLPPRNLYNYTVPWNSLYNVTDDSSKGTDNFIEEVESYLSNEPSTTALIFIGHSFGGDSILTLLQRHQRREFLFVGAIDPVDGFGVRFTLKSKEIPANVAYFFNRWQTNIPIGCAIPNGSCNFPIDYEVSGVVSCNAQRCDDQKEQSVERNSDGSSIRVRCGELEFGCEGAGWHMEVQCDPIFDWICTDVPVYNPGTKQKRISHQRLAYDPYVQQQLINIIQTLLIKHAESLNIDYGGTLHVDSTYTGNGLGTALRPFRTIGQAVTLAEDGANLQITAGVYAESIEINKKITLTALNGHVTIGRIQTSNHVEPEQGGTLVSSDSSLQLSFPAGAVPAQVRVAITTTTVPAPPTYGYHFAGRAFEVTATDVNNNIVTSFQQPLTLNLSYSDAEWQNAGIPSESNLNVYFWDGNIWHATLPCTGCLHNIEGNSFTILLDHLTDFALLALAIDQESSSMFLPLISKQ